MCTCTYALCINGACLHAHVHVVVKSLITSTWVRPSAPHSWPHSPHWAINILKTKLIWPFMNGNNSLTLGLYHGHGRYGSVLIARDHAQTWSLTCGTKCYSLINKSLCVLVDSVLSLGWCTSLIARTPSFCICCLSLSPRSTPPPSTLTRCHRISSKRLYQPTNSQSEYSNLIITLTIVDCYIAPTPIQCNAQGALHYYYPVVGVT